METCSTCKYFSGEGEEININWRSVCRRYPPGSAPGRSTALMCPVSPQYWCGEWTPAPPPPVVEPPKKKPGRPKKEIANA